MPTDTVLLAGRPVHRMGFGAMQLPGPGVFGPPADRPQALAILRRAVEAGVDHIDTAQFYGPDVANDLIHEALFPYPDQLVLVSKVGARRDEQRQWLPAQRPEDLRAGVEANLASLEVDQVPVVNLRRHPESDVPFTEQLDAMTAMRDEGLIGGVGLSNVTLDDYRTARAQTDVACVQNAYNLTDRSDQLLFDACRADEVPYVPFFPLGSAFFADNPVLDAPVVEDTADRLGATRAQVALAWLLAQAPTVLLIPGTSSPTHLDENLAAAELILDEAAIEALDQAAI
ncbi:MAG TPA: oxidoreductase [Acidimicrobiales bacterium]|nr:oxidoreductase [Acidimicrobiales bacterium]HWF21350.1 oxidoreductase [Acidimicrobiales bacterium]